MKSDISGEISSRTHLPVDYLRLSETIIEAIASAVFILQGEQMSYVNASALSITGYSKQELLAMPFRAIIHEDFQDMIQHRDRSRQAGDEAPDHYEVKIVRKDGETRWVNFRTSMIELDGKPAVLGLAEDMTERKHSEQAFQTIIKSIAISSGQGFFDDVARILCEWLHADCTIISEIVANEGRVEALGMQLDGERIADFKYDLSGTPCNNAIAKGYAVYPENICEIFPDDKEIVEMQAEGYVGVSLKDKHGQAIGILCILSRHKLNLPAKIREVLEIIAAKAAVQIERKHAEEKVRLLRQRLTSQQTAMMKILTSTPQTLEIALQEACEVSAKTLGVERVSIWLLSKDDKAMRCLNLFKRSETSHSSGTVLKSGDYPRYFAALTADRAIEAHDARSDPRTCEFTEGYLLPLGITSMLDVPIRLEGKVAGVLCHEHTGSARRWTDDELGFSCDVADQVVQALINEERKQSEAFVKQTGDILEMIATGQAASMIYDAIALMYEARHPGMRCSMLKLKGNQLMHGGAPSLPPEYCKAVNGLQNGPNIGSCGTSTYTGKRVLVEDIATDPKWSNLKHAALPHGLCSCWSEPIKTGDGDVLGAFGMYYNHPALPDDGELNDLISAAKIAGIVMEREKREDEVRKLSSALENAGGSILITDRQGAIEYVNPAFSRISGYEAEEAIGQTPRILNSGNQNAAFYKHMWDTISSGNIWHHKVIDKRKDGTLYPTMLTIAPLTDEQGNITHFVGSHADLSELESMEKNFHQAQKMEAIGTLVGGIAHDFNNMLAGMNGNLYLAKQRIRDMPDVMQNLTNVEQLSFRAADMIQQLLTFARKSMVRMKPMPLTPFISEALKLLHASVPENISLNEDICHEILSIEGDGTQLHQVLMNLINNARDAVEAVVDPSINVRLEVFRADEEFCKLHADCSTDLYAHLSVEDNGCGIPVHQLEHLFEPFFTTKEAGKGTGLGLAMVFGSIQTHHGFVDVDSMEGEGSTFHLYLPLLEPENESYAPRKTQNIVHGHGELILLADDEQHIIAVTKEVLETLGYRVLTATDGQQAVQIFEAHSDDIDLCIFDIVMPVLGGNRAAKRIRQINKKVKIIFSTGYDKNRLSDMADEAVLSKPFAIEEMSSLIRKQLEA